MEYGSVYTVTENTGSSESVEKLSRHEELLIVADNLREQLEGWKSFVTLFVDGDRVVVVVKHKNGRVRKHLPPSYCGFNIEVREYDG
jgi:hypothetical protein